MTKHYEPEFKKKIVRLHLEERRSLKSLAAEYGVSHASISNWIAKFRTERLLRLAMGLHKPCSKN